MKKLILTDIQAGVRKLGNVKALYEHIEAAYVDAMADLAKGLVAVSGNYIAVRGCVNSGDLTNYNISAGVIMKDGELFATPAFIGTAGGGQAAVLGLVSTKTQLQYTDNTTRDTLDNRTYVWTIATSGTGLVNFAGLVTLKSAINSMLDTQGQISAAIAALVDSSPGTLDTLNELAAALADDPNFATTVTNALAGKVAKAGDTMTGHLNFSDTYKVTGLADGSAARDAINKQQHDLKSDKANPAWTALTLINGWSDSGLNAAAYRVTDQNILHIRGYISSTGASSQIFANLPNGLVATSRQIDQVVIQQTNGTFATMVVLGGSPTTLQMGIGYATSKLFSIDVMIPLDADY